MLHGEFRSRWTLSSLKKVCSFLNFNSESSLWRWLRKWQIRYRRGRLYVHSPDAHYEHKLNYLQEVLADFDTERMVLLALDELTIYAKASISYNHQSQQPLAQQGILTNTSCRIVGCVNLLNGQVSYLMRNKISMATLIAFYQKLVSTYPDKIIYIVQDNWTIHYHPDVLAALQVQHFPFGFTVPKAWQQLKAKKKYTKLNLPIVLLSLPTYASWLNPIEKLWKKLKQELVHLHPFKDRMDILKEKIHLWLQQYETTAINNDLIKYIGLQNPNNFWYLIIRNIPNVKERLFIET